MTKKREIVTLHQQVIDEQHGMVWYLVLENECHVGLLNLDSVSMSYW